MKHILPTIHISDSKPFKTPKDGSTPLDALMPFYNLEVTNDNSCGDKIVLKSEDNLLIPISRTNFIELLLSISILNNKITEPCAIIGDNSSLYLIKYHSEEYNYIRLSYEESLEQKTIPKKEINPGDTVSFLKGKSKQENYVYLGELSYLGVFIFNYLNKKDPSISSSNFFQTKYIFAKFEKNEIIDLQFYSSFPKIIFQEAQDKPYDFKNYIPFVNKYLESKFITKLFLSLKSPSPFNPKDYLESEFDLNTLSSLKGINIFPLTLYSKEPLLTEAKNYITEKIRPFTLKSEPFKKYGISYVSSSSRTSFTNKQGVSCSI